MVSDPPISSPRLSDSVGYRIAKTNSEMVKALTELCEANGFSFSVWRVFSAVGSFEPVSANEICRLTTIDKAAVSRALRQLTDRKLIARRVGDSDARSVELRLTRAGREAYLCTAGAIDDLQQEVLQGIDERAKREFLSMLQLLEERTRNIREARLPATTPKAEPGKKRPATRKKAATQTSETHDPYR